MAQSEAERVKESRPPLTAPAENESQFIGVPNDYRGPARPMGWEGGFGGYEDRPSGFGTQMVPSAPRYRSGDDLDPIGWPRAQVEELQSALVSVGLISPTADLTPGWFDDTTHSAYRKLLTAANQRGITWQEAFSEIAANPKVSLDGEGEELPTIRLSNPADLRPAIKRIASRVAGEAPPELVEAIVRAYQGTEAAAGQQMIDVAGTGATVVGPPSAEGFTEDYLRRERPVEAGAVDVLEQAKSAMQFLGLDAA